MIVHKVRNKKTNIVHRFLDVTWKIKVANQAAGAYEYLSTETEMTPPSMNTVARKTQNVSSRNVSTKPANTKPARNLPARCIPCGG